MVIVVFDNGDMEHAANGGNFINLVRTKYEGVRLDLKSPSSPQITGTSRWQDTRYKENEESITTKFSIKPCVA